MNYKKIYKYKDIKKDILEAVDILAGPVVQTLSPKGSNVIFEDKNLNQNVTNDGVTIAKNITVKNPVQNAIIEIIKHSSMKTNAEAGDGTTTTILISSELIKKGFSLLKKGLFRSGINPIVLKKEMEFVSDYVVAKLNKMKFEVKTDNERMNIAMISANNDPEIAKHVVDVIDFAGEDGMVFIEPNSSSETEVVKEPGFTIANGMFSTEFRNSKTTLTTMLKDVPLFITDKRIYYPEEAQAILATALKAGYKSIVVVAKDFIGDSLRTFVSNHNKGVIEVLLIKDPDVKDNDTQSLNELAIYVNGKVFSDNSGNIVEKLSKDDFVVVSSVYSDSEKTIINPTNNEDNVNLKELISSLKVELEKDKDNKDIKKRIARLTSGTTKVKVGGATPLEISEKIYRFEDAISALRAAIKYGYLPGAGVALFNVIVEALHENTLTSQQTKILFALCAPSLAQISKNSGVNILKTFYKMTIEHVFRDNKFYGYNAKTGEFGDVLEMGIIDPFRVTEMAIKNSVSVAGVILGSNYLVVNETE